MRSCLVLLFTFCLVSYTDSLSFSLGAKASSFSGERWPCAVLNCEESYKTSVSGLDQGHVTTNSSHSTLNGMRIFITSPSSGNDERQHLLASLTLQQPNKSRVSNGIKIDGRLESRRASLRLELFKTRDCSAQFTCEVSSVDAHGTKVVRSNTLQQQRTHSAYQSKDGTVSSIGSSQYMMLVQQLALLENRLEDRMRSIEDKIENRVADKLCQLEAKCSLQSDAVRLERENRLEKYGNGITEQLEKALGVSELVMKNLNESFSVVTRHLKQLQSLNKTDDIGLSSLECPKLPGSKSDMPDTTACNRSTELFSSIHDQILITNTMINNTMQPISDLLMPKRCKKGLISFVVQTSFPYPVVRPNKESGLNVPYLCDEVTDGGGWIVIQRRTTGQEEFYRDWATYKRGFGSLAGDFWIGNDNLHALTNSRTYELRVDLKFQGKSAFAHYSIFTVASEKRNYTITIGAYDGTAGDSLRRHNGMKFSTFDRDNDIDGPRHCARNYIGAWWYKDCHDSNLNGQWGATDYKGPRWAVFTKEEPATFTEMKIRPLD